MTQEQTENENKAIPVQMPRPTYWPFVFAVSLVFLGWGLLTTWFISLVGVAGMGISLTGWIKDLLYERTAVEGEQEKLPG